MPTAGHLLRILDVYPLADGGKRTVMHRTRTQDYVVIIEGELVLILDASEVVLSAGDVVVQRGTDHAWENRSNRMARAAFFHIDARFSEELLAKLPKPLALLSLTIAPQAPALRRSDPRVFSCGCLFKPGQERLPHDVHLRVFPAILRVVFQQRQNGSDTFQIRLYARERITVGMEAECYGL